MGEKLCLNYGLWTINHGLLYHGKNFALTMDYGLSTMGSLRWTITHKPDLHPYKWVKHWQHRALHSIQGLFQDHRKLVYASVLFF